MIPLVSRAAVEYQLNLHHHVVFLHDMRFSCILGSAGSRPIIRDPEMLYVQNFNCAFVSVIGEVKTIQKLTESNLEESTAVRTHFQQSALLIIVLFL